MLKLKTAFLFICLLAICAGCAGNKDLLKKKARAKADLGLVYIQNGKLKDGVKELIEAEKIDPENADIQHELAQAYKDLGVYREALVHFKKALMLRQEFPDAQNNMGTLYLLTEQWDLAIGCFNKVISNITYSTPHFAYNNLGLAYYNKGEYQKAIDSYQKALKISPSYSICYCNLGLVYEIIGRWEKAIDAYKKALSYFPRYAAAHLSLGKCFLRLGQNSEAAKELKRTIEIDPEGPFGNEAKELILRHKLSDVQPKKRHSPGLNDVG
jgi:tetratricopeptide (TPR) repeat protein